MAAEARWLLLIHHIPPKPGYLRVKVGRRLQQLGAVPIKNSVYALPRTEGAQEDFQWLVAEIRKGGVQQASSMHVRFTTGEQTFRAFYRVDGQAVPRAALTPFKGSATLSPFVVLDTRA